MVTLAALAIIGVQSTEWTPKNGVEIYNLQSGLLQVDMESTGGFSFRAGSPLHAVIGTASENPSEASARSTPLSKSLKKGETIVVSIIARSFKGSEAIFSGIVADTKTRANPQTQFKASVGLCWTQLCYPVKLNKDFSAYSLELFLDLAHKKQVLDIGSVKIWNLGKDPDLSGMPKNPDF